jgi:hypothetical protein
MVMVFRSVMMMIEAHNCFCAEFFTHPTIPLSSNAVLRQCLKRQSPYEISSKEFLEAGIERLADKNVRRASTGKVKDLCGEAFELKAVVACFLSDAPKSIAQSVSKSPQ